jgi:hypothetical protein
MIVMRVSHSWQVMLQAMRISGAYPPPEGGGCRSRWLVLLLVFGNWRLARETDAEELTAQLSALHPYHCREWLPWDPPHPPPSVTIEYALAGNGDTARAR